ncbi:MAG: SDR family oxidoreductase [Armatimonadetes bacterium]|nr:SDR family oxidoreductase [Armatimonadota bacterium]
MRDRHELSTDTLHTPERPDKQTNRVQTDSSGNANLADGGIAEFASSNVFVTHPHGHRRRFGVVHNDERVDDLPLSVRVRRERSDNLHLPAGHDPRLTLPQDVANAVLLLASERSQWMTGNVIGVDGGEFFVDCGNLPVQAPKS